MRILKAAAMSCAVLFSVMGGSVANAVPIQSFDSGWYQNSGFTAGVNNINVGSSNLSGAIYHNWLAFNIAGLAAQNIVSATLTFYGGNGINTSSTSETLGLFDYVGSINSLIGNAQNNVGIYTDLGDGDSYGTAVVGPGPIQEFSIILSSAAIDDLNAANDACARGGSPDRCRAAWQSGHQPRCRKSPWTPGSLPPTRTRTDVYQD